jgi:transposase
MNQKRLQRNKQLVEGKIIIGIDPAKRKHQATVVGPDDVQINKSFSFPVSAEGFQTVLWKNIAKSLTVCNRQTVIFALETSCNLWQTLAFYLHCTLGYTVVLVSPLSTHYERPIKSLDFSRSDPKDAFLVASLARQGAFTIYEQFSPHSNALHALGITYDKLRKDLARNRSRLRAHIERVFPEFLSVLGPDTDSALYLWKRYLFPDEFLAMNIDAEAQALEKLSRRQHGRPTLIRLRQLAHNSIGIIKQEEERTADRLTVDAWIAQIESLQEVIKPVHDELVRLAEQLPSYGIITSLSGVGDTLGALFLANVRDIDCYEHFKQLEKLAGANLRLSQSGRYVGSRHISHIGNKRLLWVLYKMTEETAKRVPEVRIKYLKRQIKRRKHRKNVVAAIPQLLQLIVALDTDKRPYQIREETVAEMKELEQRYALIKAQTARPGHPPERLSRAGSPTLSSKPVKRITLRKIQAPAL